jgi:hypothetical protein
MGEGRVTPEDVRKPGDVRKLLGGYATGTLTDAERKALFEAALDDQELFDELAREQVLKETLESPGARDRLIATLEPRASESPAVEKAWWARPWRWALAATFAMGVVVAVALWPHAKVVELAKVSTGSPAPAAAEPVSEARNAPPPAPNPLPRQKVIADNSAPAKVPSAGPSAGAAAGKNSRAAIGGLRRKEGDAPVATPASTAATAPPPPAPAEKPAERQADTRNGVVGGVAGGIAGGTPGNKQATTEQSQLQITPAPSQQQVQVQAQAPAALPQGQVGQPAPADPLTSRYRAIPQAGGGGAGAGVSSAGRLGLAKAKTDAPRFGFRYRFDNRGLIEITPLSEGYLLMTGASANEVVKLFPLDSDGHVPAGTPIRITLPEPVINVDIQFAAQTAVDSLDREKKAEALKDVSRRDADKGEAGVVEDPTPTPKSRLSVTLPVPKRK